MDKTELRDSVTIKDPQIHKTAFIAPGAHVVGDVILRKDSSIWYNTVARADINQIIIGERSNVQDNSVIHLENDQGVIIGNDVTIGHNAIIHGCTIKDGALIGMGAIIMNGVKVGKGSIIGAGSVIVEQMIIPDYSVVVGIPGKIIKTRTENAYQENIKWAKKYVQLSKIHKNQN